MIRPMILFKRQPSLTYLALMAGALVAATAAPAVIVAAALG